MQIQSGQLDIACQVPSPNFDARPAGEISLIVMHCISLPAGHFGANYVEAFFSNRLPVQEHPDFIDIKGMKVSSHLYLRRTGAVIQFVNFNDRAWHAGESRYQGRTECNDFSVGIELEGTDRNEFTDLQYQILQGITQLMLATWQLTPEQIVGHSNIAPGRKQDPGIGFDWPRLTSALEPLA